MKNLDALSLVCYHILLLFRYKHRYLYRKQKDWTCHQWCFHHEHVRRRQVRWVCLECFNSPLSNTGRKSLILAISFQHLFVLSSWVAKIRVPAFWDPRLTLVKHWRHLELADVTQQKREDTAVLQKARVIVRADGFHNRVAMRGRSKGCLKTRLRQNVERFSVSLICTRAVPFVYTAHSVLIIINF